MYRICLLFVCVFLAGCGSSNEDWIELFNGENLDGWHLYGGANSHDGWYVKNGILTFDYKLRKGVKNANLISDIKYTNFELSIDWNIAKQGNSGIFWGVIESDQFEHPYQTGPEIQILDDNWKEYVDGRGNMHRAGSLYGLMAPTTIVSKAAGDWNHYLIHIDHNKNIGYVAFNGKEVLRFPVHGPEWEAMIAKSGFADWPSFGKTKSGHISLQDYGGKVSFKNIKIKMLPDNENL
jgi:hypothetical protein